MEKINVTYVFVIVTYRNVTDIKELVRSIENCVNDYKIIIVNNHYDDKTKDKLEQFANAKGIRFFDISNHGYGAGNNYGIEKAIELFNFRYIIISNPDILIKKFEDSYLLKGNCSKVIIGPEIVARSGKKQNPFWVFKNSFSEYLIYKGFKHNIWSIRFLGVAINKIIRGLFNFVITKNRKHFKNVYAVHGSFLLISYDAVMMLQPIYDDNMFLFWEEALLAYKARKLGVDTFFTSSIKVQHKEDGSMDLAEISTNEEVRKSYIYYFEKYILMTGY